MELTPEEQRVIGCLIEKQRTVPDSYPMTLHALVTAANQSSNRWPVTDYEEHTVSSALASLREKNLTRVVHPSHGARQPKYRHVLDEVLRVDDAEIAVLCVLLLRGPQTVGELRSRSERLHAFESLAEVEATLAGLAARDEPLVAALPRQPGQKDVRHAHLLGDPSEMPAPPAPLAEGEGPVARRDRVAELEAEVADLRRLVAHLYTVLGEATPEGSERDVRVE